MDNVVEKAGTPIQNMGTSEDKSAELRAVFGGRPISKVLLIAPPDADESLFDFSTAHRGRYMNYPPYGLGVIAPHLQAEGIDVEILNLNNFILAEARLAENEESFNYADLIQRMIAETLNAFDPDFVGITCMFSQTHQSLLHVCNVLKSLNGDIPIAVGGVHITGGYSDEKTRAALLQDLQLADFLFCYEAELSFRDFIRVVNKKADISSLTQVVFNRPGMEAFFDKRSTPEGNDLDVLPAHSMMKSSELSSNGKIGGFFSLLEKGARITTAISNRGCRAQCTFCSVRNFNGVGVRRRSVQSVIDELLELKNDHGIEHIMWLDDDFLYNTSESLLLFNEMVKQNVGLTWDCTNGVIAASCTEEVISAAADAGCIGVTIGMESGNPAILKEVRKPGTVKNFLKAAEVFRSIEQINARVFLMIGFPGETYEQILDTINVSREMDLDWYNVTILQPLPNTKIFDQMVAEGLIGDVSFSDMRYNTGGYGKHRKKAEVVRDPLSNDFKDAFSDVDMTSVPDKVELDNVWAYMNFHLNFNRLFAETRPMKLQQQYRYVENIATLIAPNNAFATYFAGYLGYKTKGFVDPGLISNLESILEKSPYWADRCREFNISPDDLKSLDFSRHMAHTQH